MLRDKLNLVLIAAIVMAICGMLVFSSASIVKAQGTLTTILIVAKSTDDAINTITFPEGELGATVSDPYNNVDTAADPQVLDVESSEPVVRLKTPSGKRLKIWLQITGWTNGVVASEDFELVDTTDTTVWVVDNVLSAGGGAATVDTGVTPKASSYKALYLEVVLSNLAGKSGISTLTILGE